MKPVAAAAAVVVRWSMRRRAERGGWDRPLQPALRPNLRSRSRSAVLCAAHRPVHAPAPEQRRHRQPLKRQRRREQCSKE